MDNMSEEYKQYKHYWETNMFLQTEELDRYIYIYLIYLFIFKLNFDWGVQLIYSKTINLW